MRNPGRKVQPRSSKERFCGEICAKDRECGCTEPLPVFVDNCEVADPYIRTCMEIVCSRGMGWLDWWGCREGCQVY